MDKQSKYTETRKLQEQLQTLLKEVGWDIRKLAEEIAIADDYADLRNDIDPNKEYEKIRKLLQRESTKPETLHYYINFVIEMNKQRNLYKIPKLDMRHFTSTTDNINWQNILDGIARISHQHFSKQKNHSEKK